MSKVTLSRSSGLKTVGRATNMTTVELHPEFLSREGKRQFAVIPYEEFVQLQEWFEDARDLLDLELAIIENKDEPTYSLEEVRAELGIE